MSLIKDKINSQDSYISAPVKISGMSIKYKLISIILIVSSIAVLLSGMTITAYQLISFRKQMVDDLNTQAKMIGTNCRAALAFNDPKDAQYVLESLEAKPAIAYASLITVNNEVFAFYRRPEFNQKPLINPTLTNYHFTKNWLVVSKEVKLDNKKVIGTVIIQSDLREMYAFIKQGAIAIGIIVFIVLIISFILSSRMQKVISQPILHLKNTAASVSENRDYSIRARKQSEDELGMLTDSFNAMLSQIENRDILLRESEERLQSILDNTTSVIYLKDTQNRYMTVNHQYEKLFHIKRESVAGKTDHDLFPADTAENLQANDRMALEQNGPVEFEEQVPQDDGIHVYISIKFPIHDAKGVPCAVCGISTDITERIENEAELKQYRDHLEELVAERTQRLEKQTKELTRAKKAAEMASRSKSKFLANMSHELRTPLNAILGFSQLMTRDTSISDKKRQNLDIINQSGEHLLGLINDILNMSKIESGQISIEPRSFDLYAMVLNIEAMIRSQAEAKRLQLTVERPPNIPQYVKTDESKLSQVLINILGNAVKYTTQGRITLRVSCQPSASSRKEPPAFTTEEESTEKQQQTDNGQWTLSFEIEDTGHGINSEHLKKIFEPFSQVGCSVDATDGTGLGLAISHKYIHLMGGDITVKSQVGKGSVFKFTIRVKPVDMADVKIAAPSQRVIGLAEDQPVYRILVVEDNKENRKLISMLLTSVGFKVQEAVDGEEAIQLFESWHPHLIWMDMRMPVMDGYTATREIRKSKSENRNLPIIALTAHAFEEESEKIMAAGCDDFVRKPFKETKIFEVMTHYLGVKFIYEKNQIEKEQPSKPLDEVITRELLTQLPEQLLKDLKSAAQSLNLKQTNEFIEQIRSYNNAVADALAKLAGEFRFEEIVSRINNK